jgi:hypothetical protein
MSMHIYSHTIILIHVNCGVRLCAVCGMRCAAVRHSNSHSMLQFAAERIAMSGSAAVRSAVCGSVLQCAAVRLCARQCGAVQRYGSVRRSGSEHIFK